METLILCVYVLFLSAYLIGRGGQKSLSQIHCISFPDRGVKGGHTPQLLNKFRPFDCSELLQPFEHKAGDGQVLVGCDRLSLLSKHKNGEGGKDLD